ncbi:UTP--glucose-1-phosphate uridylyltransferase family protein [Babesia bovis T2Bo]|uniref:UDP-N-acetylglucosamine diphosphorylase n=1 Tax=Babesia bovis TaxID=5865 RepID=A7AWL2_BABBO|nr:UTP--glucose-1-phosphate uridylyltransferase family protein [Babesia bovis T2Bo]EDO05440.1 UTP--glucose-1-phosphate uridylyltransferase family protein [Babesia bovis T2Bo]|eukprot:XP_001609008.1 UDP-N-acetylglucosamine pyrophosphorylase [Babesia bovis T2Bo]
MPDYRALLREALSPRLEPGLLPLPTVSLSNVDTEESHNCVILEPNSDERSQLFHEGITELNKGGYALLILSGGLATRLRYELPKALLPISPIRKKTLLQLHLERVRRLEHMLDHDAPRPKVFILTSKFNHDDIRNYLASVNFCGLDKDQVITFQQDTAPYVALNFDDFIPSEGDSGTLMESPKGNGDVFHALSKCTEFMYIVDKLKMIHVIAIDNALSRPLDPELLGLSMRFPGLEVLNKCVVRRGQENLGVFCKGSYAQIVEYSEIEKLPENSAAFLNSTNTIYGNICDHLFSAQFIKKVINNRLYESLPYHAAMKSVIAKSSDATETYGYALELFIFDIFAFATKLVCIEVNREMQFAPVKYFADRDFANILSAQHRMSAVAKQWLEAAGAIVKEGLIEISPSISYGGENLDQYKGKHIEGDVYIE